MTDQQLYLFASAQVGDGVQAALAGSISGDLPTPVHCEYPPAPAPLQRDGAAAPWLSAARVLHVAPHPPAGGDGTAAKPLSLLAAQAAVRAVPPSTRAGGTTVCSTSRRRPPSSSRYEMCAL